jgi:excinuclease UvrABC helicase subunit UvrB
MAEFKVVSDFSPRGDQPKAIDAIIQGYTNLKAGHPEQHGGTQE